MPQFDAGFTPAEVRQLAEAAKAAAMLFNYPNAAAVPLGALPSNRTYISRFTERAGRTTLTRRRR
jgi:hypothetical protein